MQNNKKQAKQLTKQQQFDIRLTFQTREIEEHRYYLSEKKGVDVGIEDSVVDWVTSGQAQRFSNVFSDNEENIYSSCKANCDNKKCSDSCSLTMNEIHELLDDLD